MIDEDDITLEHGHVEVSSKLLISLILARVVSRAVTLVLITLLLLRF